MNIRKLSWAFVFLFLVACGGGSVPTSTPTPATYTISGVAAPGATLSLSGVATATANTGSDGKYSFANLTNGSYNITPSLSGFTFSPTIHAVTVNSADVSLTAFIATANFVPTYSISGAISGLGAGVTVGLSPGGASTFTNASGGYTFTGLANGSYTVAPMFVGYTFGPAMALAVVNGADVLVPMFVAIPNLVPTYSISGTASAGATLNLSGHAIANTSVGLDGTYSFANLTNGSYTITPTLMGFIFAPTSQSVDVNSANVSVPVFTATANPAPTYSISGAVTGDVLSGVTISLSPGGATTTTDASGYFVLSGLVDGSYTIIPSLSGFTFTPTSQAVAVTGANVSVSAFAATATPAPTYSISGAVSGDVLSGVTISLSPGGATTTTDASGNYILSGLVDGGYTAIPTLAGKTFTPASASALVSGANVNSVNFVEVAVPMATTGKIFYPCPFAICVKDLSTGAESVVWGQQNTYPETNVPTISGGKVAFMGSNLGGIFMLTLASSLVEQKTWFNIPWTTGCSSRPQGSFGVSNVGDMAVFSSFCSPVGLPGYSDIVLMKLDGTMYWARITNDTNTELSPAICREDAATISVCFLSNKSGALDIWKQVVDKATGDLVGGQTLVTSDVVDGIRAMSVNADYSKLAFMRRVGGITRIIVKDLTSGAERDLVAGSDPYWATDGSDRIMYTDSGNSSSWAIQPDGTGEVQIPTPSNLSTGPNSLGLKNMTFAPAGY